MDVYWLEQTEADVPAGDQWLGARELLRLGKMRFAKRRADWRLGRWTAKQALALRFGLPTDIHSLAQIEIQAAPSGAPEVSFLNHAADASISISHRDGSAICAVALAKICLGCDLELVEPRSDAFVTDYFKTDERKLIQQTSPADRPLMTTLLWSAKESALKATHEGLRLATGCMEVHPGEIMRGESDVARGDLCPAAPFAPASDSWRPLHVRYTDSQSFDGWWRYANQMVRTIVSSLPRLDRLRSPHLFSPAHQ